MMEVANDGRNNSNNNKSSLNSMDERSNEESNRSNSFDNNTKTTSTFHSDSIGEISALPQDAYDSNDEGTDFVVRTLEVGGGNGGRSKALQTFAGVAGNVLEWYDFAVYGFLSDEIGKVFFPPQEGNADIVESFAVFGLAFLMRPVGGVIMGYIGDKYGRKRALELSIFLMAFPTFAMGCLPSYESVGALSIVLLVLVRCLQGLSVGGQLVSSLVYTLEQNPKRQWGLYGSYVMAAANFGTLLGGIVATSLKSSLSEEQLLSYGWRIPFLSGILVSLCGLYLKFYGDEEIHHGGGEDGEGNGNPLIMAFRKENIRPLISASLAPMLWSGGFYISFVWMATFMDVLIEPPVPNAFLVNSLALFISVCLLFPLAGYLSDKHGRTKIMYIGGISLAVISPFMIIVISKGNAVAAFFAQCAMGISLSLWGAPMCSWLIESFPPAIRLTSVAVGYNIAQAVVGGSSPALATYLQDQYGNSSPGYMISVIACFSLAGLSLSAFGPGRQYDETCSLPQSVSSGGDGLFNYDDDDENVSEMELI